MRRAFARLPMSRMLARGVAGVSAGVLAASLLGGGLLAVITEQFAFNDNRFVSDEVDIPIGVALAPLGAAASCDDVPTADFVLISEGPGNVINGLGLEGFTPDPVQAEQEVAGPIWCLWNTSPLLDATITPTLSNVVSTEVGPCDLTEIAAGDTTCGDGERGEFVDPGSLFIHVAEPGNPFLVDLAIYNYGYGQGGYVLAAGTRVQLYPKWEDPFGDIAPATLTSDELTFDLVLDIEFGLPA